MKTELELRIALAEAQELKGPWNQIVRLDTVRFQEPEMRFYQNSQKQRLPELTLDWVHEIEKKFNWVPDDECCEASKYYEQLIFVCGRAIPKEGKPFGYVCHLCGEQIYDSQQTESSDAGMIHSQCPTADCYDWHLVTATASQRAEAILKSQGLWREG